MLRVYSILRLTLAAFVCVGFCGLNWAQLNEAPLQTSGEQSFRKFSCEGCVVFAVTHENNVTCSSQTSQADAVPFVFGLSESFTTACPVFSLAGRVIECTAKAKSVLGNRMNNKDPPVA